MCCGSWFSDVFISVVKLGAQCFILTMIKVSKLFNTYVLLVNILFPLCRDSSLRLRGMIHKGKYSGDIALPCILRYLSRSLPCHYRVSHCHVYSGICPDHCLAITGWVIAMYTPVSVQITALPLPGESLPCILRYLSRSLPCHYRVSHCHVYSGICPDHCLAITGWVIAMYTPVSVQITALPLPGESLPCILRYLSRSLPCHYPVSHCHVYSGICPDHCLAITRWVIAMYTPVSAQITALPLPGEYSRDTRWALFSYEQYFIA